MRFANLNYSIHIQYNSVNVCQYVVFMFSCCGAAKTEHLQVKGCLDL